MKKKLFDRNRVTEETEDNSESDNWFEQLLKSNFDHLVASVGISRNRSVVERPPLGLPCSITRGHSRLKWYFIQTFCPSENKQGIKNVNITYFILARCEWFFKALFWICVNKLSSLKQNGQSKNWIKAFIFTFWLYSQNWLPLRWWHLTIVTGPWDFETSKQRSSIRISLSIVNEKTWNQDFKERTTNSII